MKTNRSKRTNRNQKTNKNQRTDKNQRTNRSACKMNAISKMDDRERRIYRRMMRQRQERRHKVLVSMLGMMTALCIVLIGVIFWNSVKTSASDGFKYYTGITVEAGDTLWNLADEYIDYNHYRNKDSYISEVRNINHLDESCSIEAGQLLIVPYYSEKYVK